MGTAVKAKRCFVPAYGRNCRSRNSIIAIQNLAGLHSKLGELELSLGIFLSVA